jgi:hypothetical protein
MKHITVRDNVVFSTDAFFSTRPELKTNTTVDLVGCIRAKTIETMNLIIHLVKWSMWQLSSIVEING